MSRCVVIDANRIFSELIAANHRLRQTFASESVTEFLRPKYVMVELFKHKERIAASTGLDEDSLLALLHSLLERIRFFDEDAISIGSWTEAWRRVCAGRASHAFLHRRERAARIRRSFRI